MRDEDKTREQLLAELDGLRQRVAALEASQRRYRTIIDTVPLAIGEIDRDGIVTFAGAATTKIFGYTPEELVGKAAWEPIEEGPARDMFRAWFLKTMSEQPPPSPLFGSRTKKNGQRIDIRGDWNYLRDEKGEVIGQVTVVADITESKRGEQELARNRAILRVTIDCLPFNFFAIGLDGRYILQNAISKAQHGSDVVGKRPEEVCPNEHDLAIWLENNRRAFAGEKVEGEATLSLAGEERVYYNVLVPITDETEFYGILGVNIDITERKRAEEVLQRANDELERRVEQRTAELTKANEQLRLFRKFAEASGQGFGMSDLDCRITYTNPAMLRLCGEEDIENVLGKSFLSYYPGQLRERLETEMFSGIEHDGQWAGELTFVTPAGVLKTVLTSAFQIREEAGDPLYLAFVMTDITELKQAQTALRQSHDELRAVYESLGDGLLVADRETFQLLRANAAICSMLKYSEDELLSMSIADLHPKEFLCRIVDSLQTERAGHLPDMSNVPMVRKDGSVFYADITGDTFTYQGRPCSLGVFRDVTERRQAQEMLERERRTLQHMLQASDHERQLIAYDIHDGLAQELAGAIMQFQIYDQFKDTKADEARNAYNSGVTLLRQSHNEARRLISGVRPPILDESGVMAAIAHLVHDPAFEKGPKIEFRSRVTFSRLPPIVENVIYRIVQEGLTNARNYSKSNKIVVSLVQRNQRLRIGIRDWGVGFDPVKLEENRFGLEGIRQRTRLLGGTCKIRSTIGEGTVVLVELPVMPGD